MSTLLIGLTKTLKTEKLLLIWSLITIGRATSGPVNEYFLGNCLGMMFSCVISLPIFGERES